MTARCFADTNLFLYAASKDPADAGRKTAARELLGKEDIGISAQVLQEFAHIASAKKHLGLEAEVKRKGAGRKLTEDKGRHTCQKSIWIRWQH